jgi:hypothetical protein
MLRSARYRAAAPRALAARQRSDASTTNLNGPLPIARAASSGRRRSTLESIFDAEHTSDPSLPHVLNQQNTVPAPQRRLRLPQLQASAI